MTDEKKPHDWNMTLGPTAYGARDDRETLPYKTNRPKRRRKGQLNDGEWAPGYGPKEKPG